MRRIAALPLIFGGATLLLWLLVALAPGLDADRRSLLNLKYPTRFDNFTDVARRLGEYKRQHRSYLVGLFVSAYVYETSFNIPGSFFLNICAGALFGLWQGVLLCCVLSTIGATACYLLADLFGREYVSYYCGPQVAYFQQQVAENKHRLALFLLFARLFPASPNWLLNIVAPFINIPVGLFALTVFVGLAPYNFVCVQAGAILSELTRWQDIFDSWTTFKLCSLALIPLALALFLRSPKALDEKPSALRPLELV